MNNYQLYNFLKTLPCNAKIKQVLDSVMVELRDGTIEVYRFDEDTATFTKA